MCGCLLHAPRLGTWPATQACVLTGNQTGDPLVCRSVLNPLSHTSQGYFFLIFLLYFFPLPFSPLIPPPPPPPPLQSPHCCPCLRVLYSFCIFKINIPRYSLLGQEKEHNHHPKSLHSYVHCQSKPSPTLSRSINIAYL